MAANFELYVITDESLSKGLSHVEIAHRAIMGGADAIQLRDKTMSGKDLLRAAKELRTVTKNAGVTFIVNDRLDVALLSGADGVHLGQDDLPARYARSIAPKGFILGVSARNLEEAVLAEQDGADYIGLGPICDTSSKEDAGNGCGFGLIAEVKSRVSIPVIAIGGLGCGNAEKAIKAGADGLAVISAVVSQDDVARAASRLKFMIVKAKESKRL
ncbi:MAG TPA: thiamine phosphate synthase [Methanocellaceae archaeon]|jgi:thiamine-phosphate pyrophosphorylase